MRFLLTASDIQTFEHAGSGSFAPTVGLFELLQRIGESCVEFFGQVIDFITFIIRSIIQIAELFYWVFETLSAFGLFFPTFLSAFLILYLFALIGQLIIRTV